MEAFYITVGAIMIYSIVHFAVLSFTKTWAQRNTFEQVVTIFAFVFIFALILAVSSN